MIACLICRVESPIFPSLSQEFAKYLWIYPLRELKTLGGCVLYRRPPYGARIVDRYIQLSISFYSLILLYALGISSVLATTFVNLAFNRAYGGLLGFWVVRSWICLEASKVVFPMTMTGKRVNCCLKPTRKAERYPRIQLCHQWDHTGQYLCGVLPGEIDCDLSSNTSGGTNYNSNLFWWHYVLRSSLQEALVWAWCRSSGHPFHGFVTMKNAVNMCNHEWLCQLASATLNIFKPWFEVDEGLFTNRWRCRKHSGVIAVPTPFITTNKIILTSRFPWTLNCLLAMRGKINAYLDCVSPYSYYALLYLQRNRSALRSHGIEVECVTRISVWNVLTDQINRFTPVFL